jgi:hypothetical protein
MNRLLFVPLAILALGSAAIGPCDSEPLGSADKPDAAADGPTADAGPGPGACTPDKCAGKPVIAIGCAIGQPKTECTASPNGECNWRVSCPDSPACAPADCGAIPPVAPCPPPGARAPTVCERNAQGMCAWKVGSCDKPDGGASCMGENPANACGGPGKCVPSACGCDPITGGWICTTDCGRGRDCGGADGGTGACDPNECGPTDLVAPRCASGVAGTKACERNAAGRCVWIDKCPDTSNCTAAECGASTAPSVLVQCSGGGTQKHYCSRDGLTGKCGWKVACTCGPDQCPAGPPVVCPNGTDSPYFCGRPADGAGACTLVQQACVPSRCAPQAPCPALCPAGFAPGPDGCPTCRCATGCEAHASEAACRQAPTCAWLPPGCAGAAGVPNGGCFDAKGIRCASSADCTGGKQCLKVHTNPCATGTADGGASGCAACGADTTACQ